VDSSLRSTGLGVVERAGAGVRAVGYDVLANPKKLSHAACLQRLWEGVAGCIEREKPLEIAIEGGFFFKNAQTAMILGEARGVVIAACALKGLPVFEYSPRKVKQALVGSGSAHKSQVAAMVCRILGLRSAPPEDASDALAIAICHLHHRRGVQGFSETPL